MTTEAESSRRLSKRDVERLFATYDDDPIGALETALRRMCERPHLTFDQLLAHLAEHGLIASTRRAALVRRDQTALDALATELNEIRTLGS